MKSATVQNIQKRYFSKSMLTVKKYRTILNLNAINFQYFYYIVSYCLVSDDIEQVPRKPGIISIGEKKEDMEAKDDELVKNRI
jgi:hypothetical protein